jgi:hypothetical protein
MHMEHLHGAFEPVCDSKLEDPRELHLCVTCALVSRILVPWLHCLRLFYCTSVPLAHSWTHASSHCSREQVIRCIEEGDGLLQAERQKEGQEPE